MRVLVTGGNGFIGSHLVDALFAGGHQVVVFDKNDRIYDRLPPGVDFIRADISQRNLMDDAVQNVDVVFHLCWTNVHEASNQDPAGDVVANLVPTINLLDVCRRGGVKRIVFLSSGGTVYGDPHVFPTPEIHPQDPLSAYGITKLATEKYLQLFNVLHGLDYVVYRPSVPYGPRQNPLGRQGAVAVFLHRVAKGLPITIWGDGSASRDFFYISDLVDALVKGMDASLQNQRIFNIGGAELISLKALLGRIEATVGRKAQVTYNEPRKFDATQVWLDTQAARKDLGWHPRVPIEQGLAQTWKWMQSAVDLAGADKAR